MLGISAASTQSKQRCLRLISLILLGPLLAACSWTIIPPEPDAEMAAIYLNLYGRHTRLALPDNQGRYIEYGYGDWRYYAQAERSLLTGIQALFFSSRSALSRRVLQPGEQPMNALDFGSDLTRLIKVDLAQLTTLRDKLEQQWSQSDGASLHRPPHHYRESDLRYGLFNNSNHQTVRWLEQLGVSSEGSPTLGRFIVAEPLS